jgi:hypothetical protein
LTFIGLVVHIIVLYICTDGQLGLKPEGRDEGVRMEGKRCSSAVAHIASAADGWRVGVRTEEVREKVRERYKRETIMGLAQTNIASKLSSSSTYLVLIDQDTTSNPYGEVYKLYDLCWNHNDLLQF